MRGALELTRTPSSKEKDGRTLLEKTIKPSTEKKVEKL